MSDIPGCKKVLKRLASNQHNIDLYLQQCRKLATQKKKRKNVEKRKPEQILLSFFHSKPKVPKVSAENIEVLEDIAFESQTPPPP